MPLQPQPRCLDLGVYMTMCGCFVGGLWGGLESLQMTRQHRVVGLQRAQTVLRATGSTGLAVGALYGVFRGLLCTCERVRGKNDLYNAAAAGGFTGAMASLKSGSPAKVVGTAMLAAGACGALFAMEHRGTGGGGGGFATA